MNRYISDLHFGHANIIKLDNRPFASVEEMDERLIKNWNSVVQNGDTTYILGDFCWGKEPEWKRLLPQLKGNKVLIRGNHDLQSMSAELRNMFQDVKDYKEIRDNGHLVIMCHYPILLYKNSFRPDTYMLCGHVHTTIENEFLEQWRSEIWAHHNSHGKSTAVGYGHVANVGCMMPYMDYTPRTLDELIEAFKW